MTAEEVTYVIGGGWGNAIRWLNKTQFEKPGTIFRVAGWKPERPKVGDFLLAKFGKGTAKFQFTKVDLQDNPSDMFFGTVAFVGYN